MKLIADPEQIKSLLGCTLDSENPLSCWSTTTDDVTGSIMLETTSGKYLLLPSENQLESIHKGNLPKNIDLSDLTDVEQFSNASSMDEKLEADEHTPVHLAMRENVTLNRTKENQWDKAQWCSQEISRSSVLHHFERTRERTINKTNEMLTRDSNLEAELIAQLFSFKDLEERFETLDQLMRDKGVHTLILTSRLNVQDVAAVPILNNKPPSIAIYHLDSETITVIEKTEKGKGKALHRFTADLRAGQRTVAIEDKNMTFGQLVALGFESHFTSLRPWSEILNIWRTELGVLEVPYTIMIAKITACAVERTLNILEKEVNSGKTKNEREMAIYLKRQFQDVLHDYLKDGQYIIRYLRMKIGSKEISSIFSSEDCIFKCDTSFTLEVSLSIIEEDGTVRAVSEIARTLVFDNVGKKLYDLFAKMVKADLSFATHTNARGRDVFLSAELGWEHFRNTVLENYPRLEEDIADQLNVKSIGHVLGTNKDDGLPLSRYSDYILDSGITGMIGFPVKIGLYHILYKDMFVVHPYKGLNIVKNQPSEWY